MNDEMIDPPGEVSGTLEKELVALLNRHSAENDSDTPDFVLAQFLLGCLGIAKMFYKNRDVLDVTRAGHCMRKMIRRLAATS